MTSEELYRQARECYAFSQDENMFSDLREAALRSAIAWQQDAETAASLERKTRDAQV